ncbi:hypothetical protein C7999DRAFT_15520 [Corynascus novoguineensis]|uniref:Uncharacterized protein n=1 Tax=Corynascus novoguineensis TaxID=1126955 RepID=A0AAN7CQV0_9PEZI|nr:hypothetical protein C7999DRAFT_15520 [Corynascus novoguineensis]
MAHLPPSAAIFSPSVARAAASAAKDWSYVDNWLQRKFPGRGPPPFERNPDTLRALLALASANEAADEERALIARLEAETLDQLRVHSEQQSHIQEEDAAAATTLESAREAILTALENSLPREGQTALTALAALALQTNIPLPTPADPGTKLISLSASAATLEQTASRIHALTAHIGREAAATARLAAELRPPSPPGDGGHLNLSSDDEEEQAGISTTTTTTSTTKTKSMNTTGYHPPPTLALQNLALQRQIRALSSEVPSLRDKAAALARRVQAQTPSSSSSLSSSSFPSLARVREEEEAYLGLLSTKQDLDAQVRAFAGLPHDAELARRELEGLRAELRRLEARRDEVFEGLVEMEMPRKPRR